jgi:hypothetical protein
VAGKAATHLEDKSNLKIFKNNPIRWLVKGIELGDE